MQLTNIQLSKTEMFQKQCESHGIKSTKRQASKWRLKCGSLYKALLSEGTKESFEAEIVITTVRILDAQKKAMEVKP